MARWLKLFSRVTTPGRVFLPHIDGLRFVAIAAVIAFHIQMISAFHYGVASLNDPGWRGFVNEFFLSGHLGVQLFFSVSGFILALPFAKQHLKLGQAVALKAYFRRRLTRLEPPYLIHLMILFMLCCTLYRLTPNRPEFYHNPDWFTFTWHHLLASIFYSNGFIFSTHPKPNFVLWSLEVEVQFYILAPLLAHVFKIANTNIRRILIVVVVFVSPLVGNAIFSGYIAKFSLAGNLQYFLVGFLWCDLYLTRWGSNPARQLRWDFLWLLVLPLLIWNRFIPHFYGLLPWLCLATGFAAFRGIFTGWLLGNPWISTIGGMCYTIYMYHCLLISALIRLTVGLHAHAFWATLIMQFIVMVPVILTSSAVLFVLFERPFMQRDWPARWHRALVQRWAVGGGNKASG